MNYPDTIEACHALLKEQSEQIALLFEEIKKLKAQLNQNSSNSSKPPSSDVAKPRRKPGLRKSPKSLGGQKGHKGNTLKMVDASEVNEIHELKPERCKCGKRLKRQEMEIHAIRQLFDIPDPRLEVYQYQQMACTCPDCGEKNMGQFPAHVKAPVQYGSGVVSFINLLSVRCHLSYKNISDLFKTLFGYAVNSATIESALNRADTACEDLQAQIKTKALEEALLHLDETGIQIEKKRHWLHTISNEQWTFLYPHISRGKQALVETAPELFAFLGIVVHDCWPTYWSLKSAKHVLCNAHILRELTALIEQGSKWAKRMHDLLIKLYKDKYSKNKLISPTNSYVKQYQEICEQALEEEPPPKPNARGRPTQSKGRNLADRLIKHKEAVLRFVLEANVPFTNNQAERDIRPVKGKLKVAGCFRTWKGAKRYARIQSVYSTWRKQKYNLFTELKSVLEGKPFQFETALT